MTERELDDFAERTDPRIHCLNMHVEGSNPPFWVRESWERDARYGALPRGPEAGCGGSGHSNC